MVAAVLTMSGCATPVLADGQPSATSASPTPTATQTATPTPDPLAGVVAMVARPQAIELRDASGAVVASLSYTSPVAETLAIMTTLLQGAPVDESYEGGNHNAPGVLHTWDDALVIDEVHYGEGVILDGRPSLGAPAFRVSFDAPEVRGLELTTAPGVHADASFAELGDLVDPDLWTCSGWAIEYVESPSEHGGTVMHGVGLSNIEWDDSSERFQAQVDYVASIVAPVSVAAGCV